MPADLQGNLLSDVYTSFLHLSSTTMASTPEFVYDGSGNMSPLSLSTTSVKISSNFYIGSMLYPNTDGASNNILTTDGAGTLTFRSIGAALSSVAPLVNGTYSSSVLTVANNIITGIANTGSRKTFFIDQRIATVAGPSREQLIAAISWPYPVSGDVALVIQKVMALDGTLSDLAVTEFTSDGTSWGTPKSY